MGDLSYRMVNALLASEFLPASLRTRAMRLIGFGMSKQATIWSGANLRSRRASFGDGVFINVGFYFDGYDRLEIGNNVRIGPYVKIITATHDIGPPHQRGLVEVKGMPVSIRDGCWIGTNATILPGVTVDHGCVIAAGAVVYETTEPDGLYAGNPARRVRDLSTDS